MDDIIDRLRSRSYSTKGKDPLVEEAADLIEQMGRTRDPGDIVTAARAHIASLPKHLKDRYSATLICKLIAKVLVLEELREQDGVVIGIQLREYQKMQERCVDGDFLTDAEREAVDRLRNGAAGYTNGISASGESNQSYEKDDRNCVITDTIRLTDAEREAIDAMACYFDARASLTMQSWGSLLRILLERLKCPS